MQLNNLLQAVLTAFIPVSFLVASPAIAANPLPNPNNCTCNVNDSFDPQARMPKGPLKGQCINSCKQRSVKLLTSAEAAPYRPLPGMLVVANVSHGGDFWVAQIPTNAIEDVIFQIEHFPAVVPAAHTQLRFRFKRGTEVLLVSQAMNAPFTQVGIKDLVYSVEAVGIPEGRFDLVAGFFDRFALAYRLISLQDRAEQMLVKDQHRVEQLKLNLKPEAKQQLLRKAILFSDRAGMRKMYDTFARNCTTELFHAIDQSIQYDGRRQSRMTQESFANIPTGSFISRLLQNKIFSFETLKQRFSSLQTHIPTVSTAALKRRGLIAANGQSQMPTLNDESKTNNRVITD